VKGTGQRRPRNLISRIPAIGLLCADLLDEGLTDNEVARTLAEEFKRPIQRRTVAAFRTGDYQKVSTERRDRQDASNEVRLIIGAAREAGATYAQAGTDMLAKMFYDLLVDVRAGKGPEGVDLVQVGKTLAKIQEIEIERGKTEIARLKAEQATAIKNAVGSEITKEQLVDKVDEILGLKKA
jgi:hypothetical protein